MPWQTNIWVVAPGQPPPALTFLFAPLRCYWIPWAPPSVHCCHRLSCSVSVSQCMGCARTWAAQGSQSDQLCTPPYPVLRSLLPVSDLSPENLDSSLLLTAMHFSFCFSFQLRISAWLFQIFLLLPLFHFLSVPCSRSRALASFIILGACRRTVQNPCLPRTLLSCFYPLSCMQSLLPL